MTYRLMAVLAGLFMASTAMGCSPDNGADRSGLTDVSPGDAGVDGASFRLRFEEVSFDHDVKAITEMKFIPGSGAQFLMLQKTGQILHFELDGDTANLLASATIDGVDDTDDCGLLSMAFDPDFEQNNYLYLGYCVGKGDNIITRHTLDLDELGSLNDESAEVIRVTNPNAEEYWHNVGSLQFGPQGYLWALFGENAAGAEAQNLSRPTGSLIRIKPDPHGSQRGWQPAPDNPFVGQADKHDAIYAWGLRSPWRGLLDEDGRYWVADVGAAENEEINIADQPGLNFGWPGSEGPCETNCDNKVDPVLWWNRQPDHPYALDDPDTAPTDRRASWVGLAYEATSNDRYDGQLDDKIVYGDFCTGWIRAVSHDGPAGASKDAAIGHLSGVVSWSVGPDGYAYVTTYGNCKTFPYKPGTLYRAVLDSESR